MAATNRRAQLLLCFAIVAMCALATACGKSGAAPASGTIDVQWHLEPNPPATGEQARLRISLRDGEKQPIRGAKLQIESNMSHPGMAPLISPIAERGDGEYEGPVQLTMSGDWVVVVSGTLPDGRPITRSLDVKNVQ